MAATAPVEVGSRGTIGSLLRKEIDYFRRLEIDCYGSSIDSQGSVEEMGSGRRGHWPNSLRFLSITWKKGRKNRGNGGMKPGICSMVEIADSHRGNEIHGFRYRNLRVESERFNHA